MQDQITCIYFPNGSQIFNVHFSNELDLTPKLNHHSVEGTMYCLDTSMEVVVDDN